MHSPDDVQAPASTGDAELAPVIAIEAAGRAPTVATRRRRRASPRAGRPRTAFVLSGGASLGALQPGMLQALYEQGIVPDVLVATSAGAINAAFVASRPQTAGTARALARLWCGLERDDVFPLNPWVLVGGVLGSRDHLVAPDALRRLLMGHLQFADLADAPIPLHVVAFDLETGSEVLLSEGSAIEAIAASAAVPGVFPPVEVDGRCLIDGGVVNNTPISHAVELGAERIYVLPTIDRELGPIVARTALRAAVNGIGLMMRSRLEADIARFSSRAELIVLPTPSPLDVLPMDFGHADRLVGDALRAAREWLAQPEGEPAAGRRSGAQALRR